MVKTKRVSSKFYDFIRDRGGNFAILSGALAPLIFGAAGFAIDTANLYAKHRQYQEITDYTALSTATALNTIIVKTSDPATDLYATTYAKAVEFGKDTLVGQVLQQEDIVCKAYYCTSDEEKAKKALRDKIRSETNINVTMVENAKKQKVYTVTVNYAKPVKLGLMAFLGFPTRNVNVTSISTAAPPTGKAFSLFFLTDISQSVGDKNNDGTDSKYKINDPTCATEANGYKPCTSVAESARTALGQYLNYIDAELNKDGKFIRVGGSAFHGNASFSSRPADLSTNGMSWTTSNLRAQLPNYFFKYNEPDSNIRKLLIQTSFNRGIGYLDTGSEQLVVDGLAGLTEPSEFSAQRMLLATNGLGKSIEQEAHRLEGNLQPRKAVVIFSDGASMYRGGRAGGKQACTTLRMQNVEIFAIQWYTPDQVNSSGVLTSEGEKDRDLMQKDCATQDNQHYYLVKNKDQLLDVFKGLTKTSLRSTALLTN